MKKRNKRTVSKVFTLCGVVLLVLGVLVLLLWQGNTHFAVQRCENYLETIRQSIPAPQGAIPEERRDNTMPVLAVEKTDFVGILEMPRYACALPVGAVWGRVAQHPCRFSGSVYDGTMQIGATTQKGQYDFYREISVGDTVLFTDMEGNRFTYTVTAMRYEKHADVETLAREEAALTLFIKNVYAFEYLIVSCDSAR